MQFGMALARLRRESTYETHAPMENKLSDESGNLLILAALSMTALMGFVALGTDVGLLFRAKRNVQIAADAAAMAGALDFLYNGSASSAQAAGQAASSANGFAGGGGTVVTINTPPASGPNAGSVGFVEAVVSAPRNTFFMAMFGFKTMTVTARAVAADPTAGDACIWLMATSGKGLNLQGSYTFSTRLRCLRELNTSDAIQLRAMVAFHAKFLTLSATSSLQHQTSPTAATMNAAPRKSPWGNINRSRPGAPARDATSLIRRAPRSLGTLPAGAGKTVCYTNGITINTATFDSGTLGNSIANDVVTSPAGTLVFGNGVTISTGSTVTVFGGTIDINKGSLNQRSNSVINAIAPTSGTYNGIAIMQPANNNSDLQVQFGSNNQVLDGYIYAPGAKVYLQDSGGGITAAGLVAKTMYNQTSQITIPSYDAAHPDDDVNRVVTLTE
jgi:hypothetical protein